MREQLSSRWTFFWRVIFPVTWSGGSGLIMLTAWLGWMDHRERPAPLGFKVAFLAGWVVGSAFLLWFARRLRTVWLEDDHLVVAGFGSEEIIPLHRVENVTETRWWRPKMIKVRLQRLPGLPKQVVFVVPEAFDGLFADHPVVQKLRARMEEAWDSGPRPF